MRQSRRVHRSRIEEVNLWNIFRVFLFELAVELELLLVVDEDGRHFTLVDRRDVIGPR